MSVLESDGLLPAPSQLSGANKGPGPSSRLLHSVLVVDDDDPTRNMVGEMLTEAGFDVVAATSAEEAIALSTEREFGVTLTDLHMPGTDGLALLASLRELRPSTPCVLMTAFGSVETAVEAMRAGALDYVTKPFTSQALLVALERAFERRQIEEGAQHERPAADRLEGFGELVGKSKAMNEIYDLIRKIASCRSNVLITGESGTGKEVIARTIHATSSRKDGPFVPLNCTAMPEGVLESELFGHARGAFTGAHAKKKGLFEVANGGMIFLDEIGDMPLALQGKLLRVLQEREVRPVGANESVSIDARVIAATNRDLKAEIEKGRFREDLYYRLNVLPVDVPPLRERPEDIEPLAKIFIEKHCGSQPRVLSKEAVRKLTGAPWRGNVRELENAIERAIALSDTERIDALDLCVDRAGADETHETLERILTRLATERRMSVRDLTELYIDCALKAAGGSKGKAAKMLGINRRTLYRREERQQANTPEVAQPEVGGSES